MTQGKDSALQAFRPAGQEAVIDFLVKLWKLDRTHTTPRDVILLYTIMTRPSVNGKELTRLVGLEDRSSIQLCIRRLIRHGLVEDRRVEGRDKLPNRLYITPAGQEFWNSIKP